MTDGTNAPTGGTDGAGSLSTADDGTVSWWQAEPDRFQQDRCDIAALFTDLAWNEPPQAIRRAGGWHGRLPLWPFNRAQPPELARVGQGLLVQLVYSQAYPVIAPAIYPVDPQPEVMQLTDHRWHLNGDGSLCLLQSADQWSGRDSVTDLLLKAAAWRIEYALMQAGLVEAMTDTGIVSTDALDPLISQLPTSGDSAGVGRS